MSNSAECCDNASAELPRFSKDDIQLLGNQSIEERTKIFKALGDPNRLQMLHLLGQVEDICTCEFQDILSLSQPSVSYHTKVLLDAGLIERRARGPWSHYVLSNGGLSRMVLGLI
jgi:ArsR family transcriptional regulator